MNHDDTLLRAALRGQIAETKAAGLPSFFTARRDPSRPHSRHEATNAWSRTRGRAEIGVPHYLRHTFVTRALRRGIPTSVVARIVGHSSTRMIDE